MKFGKRLFAMITLLLVFIASTTLFVACGKGGDEIPDSSSTPVEINIPLSGSYYYDAEEGTYTLNFSEKGFTVNFGEELTGTYKYDGKKLSTTLNNGESISVTLDENFIKVTYGDHLYRLWRVVDFTVTYNSNGGSAVASEEVTNGKTLAKPADPTKDGYTFVGWYKDAALTQTFAFNSEPVTSDMTLYAYYVEKTEAMVEYNIYYNMSGKGEETYEQTRTVGGVAYYLPTPEVEGETFIGWWVSENNNPNKLTYKYEGQALEQNTTLYAVWESDNALYVSAYGGAITWNSVGTNARYTVTVTNTTTGEKQSWETLSTTVEGYEYTGAYEYTVNVTTGTGNNKKQGTAYVQNNALAKVSNFAVEGDSLVWNPVRNAKEYYITIEAAGKLYANIFNGASTNYNFGNYDMTEEGIKFTVTAAAADYKASTSDQFTFVRYLEEVTGVTVDAANTVTWNAVAKATAYTVAVTYEGQTEYFEVGDATSFSLAEWEAGQIDVTVTAKAKGYVATTADYSYEKVTLAAPKNVALNGATLTWDAVKGAVNYTVYIGDEQYTWNSTTLEITEDFLTGDQDKYTVYVVANAFKAVNSSTMSKAINLSLVFDELYYEAGALAWDSYIGADYYIVYLNGEKVAEVRDGSNQYKPTYTQAGENTLEVAYVDFEGNESVALSKGVNTYKVTLDVAGGSPLDDMYKAYGDTIELPYAIYRGYTFDGWYNVPRGNVNNGMKITMGTMEYNANITLYASWNANTYKVTFDLGEYGEWSEETMSDYANDQGEVMIPVKFASEYSVPTPKSNDITKTFVGWFSGSDLALATALTDEKGAGKTRFAQFDDTTLYAIYGDLYIFTELSDGNYKVEQSIDKTNGVTMNVRCTDEMTIPGIYNGKMVTELQSKSFASITYLKKINIPDTLSVIDVNSSSGAFYSDSYLEEINVYHVETEKPHEVKYASVDGVLYRAELDYITLVLCPRGKTGELAIAEEVPLKLNEDTAEYENTPVEAIAPNALYSTKLTNVVIPYTVLNIGTQAIYSTSVLENITFAPTPNGEQVRTLEIAESAFKSLSGLTSVTIPARMSNLELKIFNTCAKLAAINVEEGGTKYASVGGVVTNAEKSEIVLVPQAFAGNEYDQETGEYTGVYTIPSGITTIGESAFGLNVGITKVIIPGYVTTIKKEAFREKRDSKTLKENITEIVFLGDELSDPLTICEAAFYGLNNITELTLPVNLVNVEKNAFGNTSKLTTVTILSKGDKDNKVNFAEAAFGTDSVTPTYYVTTLNIGKDAGYFAIASAFGSAKLVNINVDPENQNYTEREGVLFNKAVTDIVYYPATKEGEFTVPSTVTTIAANVFYQRTKLTGITINWQLSSIGAQAFYGCTGLTYVAFEATPEGETPIDLTIETAAFRNCSGLTGTLTLPERLISLGEKAFYGCSKIEAAVLPSTLTEITYAAKTSSVPAMYDVFYSCSKLSSITVDDNSTKYMTIDGVMYEKDAEDNPVTLMFAPYGFEGKTTIPSTVTKIFSRAFYQTALTEITFAENVSEIEIGAEAFYYARSLKKVALPEGMTEIPSKMFNYCTALEEVTIPWTVGNIGTQAFGYCYALTTVNFEETPEGETPVELTFADGKSTPTATTYSYSYGVFNACRALEELVLPERTVYVGAYLIGESKNVKRVVIPSTVRKIQENAFYAISAATGSEQATNIELNYLEEIVINTRQEEVDGEMVEVCDLTEIGKYAFAYTHITDFVMPDSVTTLGDYVFYYCKQLVNLKFSNSLTKIPNNTFYTGIGVQAEKDTIVIPEGVTEIGNNAFYYNSAKHFYLPSTLTKIGSSAFYNCKELQDITIPANVTDIGSSAFQGATSLSSVTFALNDAGKSKIKSIGINAFNGCKALESIVFPESTNSSGITVGNTTGTGNVFSGDDALTYVYLSSSVKSVKGLFAGCKNITNIEVAPVGASFKMIEGKPYLYDKDGTTICYALSIPEGGVVTIEEGITAIGPYAFQNKTELTKITLPSTIKTVDEYAFSACGGLETIEFAQRVYMVNGEPVLDGQGNETMTQDLTAINKYAFYKCVSLKDFAIPDTLATIGQYAFEYCTSITSLELPESVNNISNNDSSGYVFAEMYALKYAYIPQKALQQAVSKATYMFKNCYELETVVIGDGAKSLPNNMFQNCYALKSVTAPDTITAMGTYVFDGCYSLDEFTIPANVTAIGNYDFQNTSIQEITIPAKVTSIGTYAFRYTPITSVSIPATVKTIGNYAFADCPNLESFTFETKADGTLALTVTNGCGTYMLYNDAALKSFTFPEKYAFKPSRTQATFMLSGTGIRTMTLPSSVNILPNSFFQNCLELEEVIFEGTLTTVGQLAFANCPNLTTVYDKSSPVQYVTDGDGEPVTDDYGEFLTYHENRLDAATVGYRAFEMTSSLTSMKLPKLKVTSAGSASLSTSVPLGITSSNDGCNVFAGSAIETFEFPALTTVIPSGFFALSNIKTVTFEDASKITAPGGYVFYGCKNLEEFTMPSGVEIKSLPTGNYFFQNSGIRSFASTANMTNIPNYMFDGCEQLEEFTFSGNETQVGYFVFRNCKSLESITFPDTLTSFNNSGNTTLSSNFEGSGLKKIDLSNTKVTTVTNSFARNCLSLKEVKLGARQTTINNYAFAGCTSLEVVSYSSTTKMGDYVFQGCTSLEETSLPANLSTVGKYVFEGSGLKKVTVPDNWGNIDAYLFYGCTELTEINFPAGCKAIDAYAFAGCTMLDVEMSPYVTTIGEGAFAMTALTEINIPASTTEIGAGAFAYNNATFTVDANNEVYKVNEYGMLAEKESNKVVALPGAGNYPTSITYSLESPIQTGALVGSNVTELIIAEGITEIDPYMFMNMDKLEALTIAASVETFGERAFTNCPNLKTVTFAGERTTIEGTALYLFENSNIETLNLPATLETIATYTFASAGIGELNIPAAMTDIAQYAFYKANIGAVNFPSTIKNIGAYAFEYATIGALNFPADADLDFIGTYAFAYMAGPETVIVPKTYAFGTYAFAYSTGVKYVQFAEGMTGVYTLNSSGELNDGGNTYLFAFCPDLVSATFASTMTYTGYGTFYQSGIKTITIPANIMTVGYGLFEKCAELTSVTFEGEFVDWIKMYAFAECTSLKTLYIPEVRFLDSWNFKNYTEDQTVYFAQEKAGKEWGSSWNFQLSGKPCVNQFVFSSTQEAE